MSCPNWTLLCEERDATAEDPSGWSDALAHLDECPSCQNEAPSVDPLLLFQRLPAVEVDRDGIEAMKQAVAGMRRGEALERRSTPHRQSSMLHSPWLRAAAVVTVLAGSILLRGNDTFVHQDVEQPLVASIDSPARVEGTSGIEKTGFLADSYDLPTLDLEGIPLVEPIDPSYSSIIQVVDDDISLVVVLPAESDV